VAVAPRRVIDRVRDRIAVIECEDCCGSGECPECFGDRPECGDCIGGFCPECGGAGKRADPIPVTEWVLQELVGDA
jgi:hypothetical protein